VALGSLVEFGYRLIKGPIPVVNDENDLFCVPDQVLGYRFRPGAISPQGKNVNCINNAGFRGADISIPKPPGTFRILCVGDSATNGVNVHNSETFPSILGEMLKGTKFEGDIQVEVVNAGVPGYLSDHHLYLLERKYLQIEPDVVVFMMGVTDVSAILLSNATWDAIRGVVRNDNFLPPNIDRFFREKSSAYYWITTYLRDYFDTYRLNKTEKKDLTAEIENGLTAYSVNFQKMIDICRKKGIVVVNVNFPWKFTSRVGREDNFIPLKNEIKYFEFNLYWQAMPILSRRNNELATNNSMLSIDIQPDVLKAKDRFVFFGDNDFTHPNIAGNFLIASRVYQAIVSHVLEGKVVEPCDGLELANKYLLGLAPDS